MSSDRSNLLAEHSLADVIDFQEGPGILAKDFHEQGVPLIRLAGLSGASLLDGCNRLSPEKVDRKWGHFRLVEGDTLLSTSASLGRVARVTAEAVGAIPYTGIIRFRPRDGRVLSEFIPYLIAGQHFQQQVEAMGAGSVMKHFGPTHLRMMSLRIPSLDAQRRIVQVLGGLDDKIGSNRRLATLLEEVVGTLYRASFVDFVGVDDLKHSEIGLIPAGWDVRPVGDVVLVKGGSTPSTRRQQYWEGENCWATPKDLAGARVSILLDTNRHITNLGVEQISSRQMPPRTVLLSSRAPVGYTAICYCPISVNQGFIAIPPSDKMPGEFVLFWLRENLDLIKQHAGGTTFAEINKSQFRPLPMIVPPQGELERFAKVARPTFDKIAALVLETETLATLRDELLTKLIAGEVRVSDMADSPHVLEATAKVA